MTIPINMTLYRLLVKQGATEQEAEEAAKVDASLLATKADLTELKASLIMWLIALFVGQTSLIFAVLRFFIK